MGRPEKKRITTDDDYDDDDNTDLYGDITDEQDKTTDEISQDDVDGDDVEEDDDKAGVNFDLYDDMIVEEGEQQTLSYQEMCNKFEKAMTMIADLEKENTALRTAILDKETTNQTVKRNMSSLLVTARGEICRKEKEIVQLRKKVKIPFSSPRHHQLRRDEATSNLSSTSIDSNFEPLLVSSPSSINSRLRSAVTISPSKRDKERKPRLPLSPRKRSRDDERSSVREDVNEKYKNNEDKYKSPEKYTSKRSDRYSQRESRKNLDKYGDTERRRNQSPEQADRSRNLDRERKESRSVLNNKTNEEKLNKTSPCDKKKSKERDEDINNRDKGKVLDLREKLRLKRLKAGVEQRDIDNNKKNNVEIEESATLSSSQQEDSPTKFKHSENNCVSDSKKDTLKKLKSPNVTEIYNKNDEFKQNGNDIDHDVFGTGTASSAIIKTVTSSSRQRNVLGKAQDNKHTLSDDEIFLKKLKSSINTTKMTSPLCEKGLTTCKDNEKEDDAKMIDKYENKCKKVLLDSQPENATLDVETSQELNLKTTTKMNSDKMSKTKENECWTDYLMDVETDEMNETKMSKGDTFKSDSGDIHDLYDDIETENNSCHVEDDDLESEVFSKTDKNAVEDKNVSIEKTEKGIGKDSVEELIETVGGTLGENVKDTSNEGNLKVCIGGVVEKINSVDKKEKVSDNSPYFMETISSTHILDNISNELTDGVETANHVKEQNKLKTPINSDVLSNEYKDENAKLDTSVEDNIKGRLRQRPTARRKTSESEIKKRPVLRSVTSETISSVTSAEMSESVTEVFKNMSGELDDNDTNIMEISQNNEINSSVPADAKVLQKEVVKSNNGADKQNENHEALISSNTKELGFDEKSEGKTDTIVKTDCSKVMMNRACDQDGCTIKSRHIHPKSKSGNSTDTKTNTMEMHSEKTDSDESSVTSDSDSESYSGSDSDSSEETDSESASEGNVDVTTRDKLSMADTNKFKQFVQDSTNKKAETVLRAEIKCVTNDTAQTKEIDINPHKDISPDESVKTGGNNVTNNESIEKAINDNKMEKNAKFKDTEEKLNSKQKITDIGTDAATLTDSKTESKNDIESEKDKKIDKKDDLDDVNECESEGSFGSNILSEQTASLGSSDVSGSSVSGDSSDYSDADTGSSYSSSEDDSSDEEEDIVVSKIGVAESVDIERKTEQCSIVIENVTFSKTSSETKRTNERADEKCQTLIPNNRDVNATTSKVMTSEKKCLKKDVVQEDKQIKKQDHISTEIIPDGKKIENVQTNGDEFEENMDVDIAMSVMNGSNKNSIGLTGAVKLKEKAYMQDNSKNPIQSVEKRNKDGPVKSNAISPKKSPRKTPKSNSTSKNIYSVLQQSPDKSFLLQSLLYGVNAVMETKKMEESHTGKQKTECDKKTSCSGNVTVLDNKSNGNQVEVVQKSISPTTVSFVEKNTETNIVESSYKLKENNSKQNKSETELTQNSAIDQSLKDGNKSKDVVQSESQGSLSEMKLFGSTLSVSSDSSYSSSGSSYSSSGSTGSSASSSSNSSSSTGSSSSSRFDDGPNLPDSKVDGVVKEMVDKSVLLNKNVVPTCKNKDINDKNKKNNDNLSVKTVEKLSEYEVPMDVDDKHNPYVILKSTTAKCVDIINNPKELKSTVNDVQTNDVEIKTNPYIELDEIPVFLDPSNISSTENEMLQKKAKNKKLPNVSLATHPLKQGKPMAPYMEQASPLRVLCSSNTHLSNNINAKEKGKNKIETSSTNKNGSGSVPREETVKNENISECSTTKNVTKNMTKKDKKPLPLADKHVNSTVKKDVGKSTKECTKRRISPRKKANKVETVTKIKEDVILRRSPRKTTSNVSVESGSKRKTTVKGALFRDTKSDETIVTRTNHSNRVQKSNSTTSNTEQLKEKSLRMSPRKKLTSKLKTHEKFPVKSPRSVKGRISASTSKEYNVSRDAASGIKLKVSLIKTGENKTHTKADENKSKQNAKLNNSSKDRLRDTGKELTDMILKLKAEQNQLKKELQQKEKDMKNTKYTQKEKVSSSKSKEIIERKALDSTSNSKHVSRELDVNKKIKQNKIDPLIETDSEKTSRFTKKETSLAHLVNRDKEASVVSSKFGAMNNKETKTFESKVTDYENYILNMKSVKKNNKKVVNEKLNQKFKPAETNIAVQQSSSVKRYKIPKVTSTVNLKCTQDNKAIQKTTASKDNQLKSIKEIKNMPEKSKYSSKKSKLSSPSPKKKDVKSSKSNVQKNKSISEAEDDANSSSDVSSHDSYVEYDDDNDNSFTSGNSDMSDTNNKLVKAIFGSSGSSVGSRKSLKLTDLRKTSSEDTDDIAKELNFGDKRNHGSFADSPVIDNERNPQRKKKMQPNDVKSRVNELMEMFKPVKKYEKSHVKTIHVKPGKTNTEDRLERTNGAKSEKTCNGSVSEKNKNISDEIKILSGEKDKSRNFKRSEIKDTVEKHKNGRKSLENVKSPLHTKGKSDSKEEGVEKCDKQAHFHLFGKSDLKSAISNDEKYNTIEKDTKSTPSSLLLIDDENTMDNIDYEDTISFENETAEFNEDSSSVESGDDVKDRDSGSRKVMKTDVRETFETNDTMDSEEDGEIECSESDMDSACLGIESRDNKKSCKMNKNSMTPRKDKVINETVNSDFHYSPIKFPSSRGGGIVSSARRRSQERRKSDRELIKYESDSDSCNELHSRSKDGTNEILDVAKRSKSRERKKSPRILSDRRGRHRSPVDIKKHLQLPKRRSPYRRSRSPRYRSPRRDCRHRSRSYSPRYKHKPPSAKQRDRGDRNRKRDSIRYYDRIESDFDSPKSHKRSSRHRESSAERTPDVKGKYRGSGGSRSGKRRERLDSASSCCESSHDVDKSSRTKKTEIREMLVDNVLERKKNEGERIVGDFYDDSESNEEDKRFSKLHSEKKSEGNGSKVYSSMNSDTRKHVRYRDEKRNRDDHYSRKRRYHSSSDSCRSRSRTPPRRTRKRRRSCTDSETESTDRQDRYSKSITACKSKVSEKENMESPVSKRKKVSHGHTSAVYLDSSRDSTSHRPRKIRTGKE